MTPMHILVDMFGKGCTVSSQAYSCTACRLHRYDPFSFHTAISRFFWMILGVVPLNKRNLFGFSSIILKLHLEFQVYYIVGERAFRGSTSFATIRC
jgi:hypothetical protein